MILLHEDDILLVKNWFGHQNWTLPGGGTHKDESEIHALQRELYEEITLVLPSKHIRHLGNYRLNSTPAPYMVSIYYSSVSVKPALMQTDGEIIESKWFNRQTLPPHLSPEIKHAISLVPPPLPRRPH